MNPQRSLNRKIAYVAGMVLIAMALALLGSPAVRRGSGADKAVSGGLLAELRVKHNLSEAQIGDLDPTSQTLKLATFGLRGAAVNILWHKAATYKMKKDWSNFAAAIEQIAKLEPHFIKVWQFQAWELSYNVAAEFDDYHERYRWLLRGVEFLQEGMRHNENEYVLVNDVGHFLGMKMGRADEVKLYRELFKHDDEFHGDRPVDQRDNWLVAKLWHRKAVDIVDAVPDPLSRLKRATPVLFYRCGPMCRMSFAEFREKDGFFGETAREAWNQAQTEWDQFGARQIPVVKDVWVVLGDKEKYDDEVKRLTEALDKLEPGLRAKIQKERYDALTPDEKRVKDLPMTQIKTRQDGELKMQLDYRLNVTNDQLARRITANQKQALDLARRSDKAEEEAFRIERERSLVSFSDWRRTAIVEQQKATLDAREAGYKADEASRAGDLIPAKAFYEKSFREWRKVFDDKRWPDLINNEVFCTEIVEGIDRYRALLAKSDEKFPEDFPLKELLRRTAKASATPPQATGKPSGTAPAKSPKP